MSGATPVPNVNGLKTLFVIKSDIICISCYSKVCKFPQKSMDENYMQRPSIGGVQTKNGMAH